MYGHTKLPHDSEGKNEHNADNDDEVVAIHVPLSGNGKTGGCITCQSHMAKVRCLWMMHS